MSLDNRAAPRNVYIDHGDTGDCLGGMYQGGSVTEVVFLWMLADVLLNLEPVTSKVNPWASRRTMTPTNNRLNPVIPTFQCYRTGTCFEVHIEYTFIHRYVISINTIEHTQEPYVQQI